MQISKKDLIPKIRATLSKGEGLSENDVRAVMMMARQEIEKMSEFDRKKYLTLKLFCDWAAHVEITKSKDGLEVLSRINKALVSVQNSSHEEI